MKAEALELYLALMKALESGPFEKLAKQLREELEGHMDDTRLDFLGNKHQRDLNNYIARYPNFKYASRVFVDTCQSLLHTQRLPTPHSKASINMFHRIRNKILHGPDTYTKTIPTELYINYEMQKRIMAHLASTYCVCFDQTGQFIFTGSDDHLIKIWCARTGRLLRTLRGHKGHVCDMSVNFENRLLASAGTDKIIRIWDLKSTKLLECFSSHHALVTSVKFSPYNRHGTDRYLVSTSNDGTVVIWKYHVENFGFERLVRFQERNRVGGQMTCSSFSTGGSFLACGASDNYIQIYGFHPNLGPYWIAELLGHSDNVDSVQFCNLGYRFISGSKDGTAVIWTYKKGVWQPLKLNMDTQLNQEILIRPKKEKPPMVLIVQWSRDDRYVMTSLVDYSIKVWNSRTGELVYILREHKHDIYFLESHPRDPRIFVSASHDGSFCVWDLHTGQCIKKIVNVINPDAPQEIENRPSIFDIKFSPDGNMLAATDAHGYLTIYGTGKNDLYQKIPEQMFFSTDYAPLIVDIQHFVMDEATHMPPHLMPKPLLVDMNGNPYPRSMQSLVTDYQCGQRAVVPAMTPIQLSELSSVIAKHSEYEDEEYIVEKNTTFDRRRNDDYDTDATIIDSDATEIDDYYEHNDIQASFYNQHNLRSRNLGGHSLPNVPQARARRCSARLRRTKRRRY